VAEVAVPGSTDPELIEFLGTLGLRPGVRVEMVEKHPFDGPVVVRVEGQERTVGDRVARQIYVKKDPPPEPAVSPSTPSPREEQPV
jgi:Fe2+ transport system protein FeoA